MRKVLFITHNASLTGAPYVLLLLIKWITKVHKELVVDIVFLEKGDLYEDFINNVNASYDYGSVRGSNKSLLQKILKKLTKKNYKEAAFLKKIAKNDYDIIYANTIASVDFATKIKNFSKSKTKLVAHIHELNTVIKEYLPNFNKYLTQIDAFISVSDLVKENLNSYWNVVPEKNHLVYEFSDKIVYKKSGSNNESPKEKIFNVGASGVVHWRKGDDLFIQVARYIKKNYPDFKIKFTWVGHVSERHRSIVEADIFKADLTDVVFFVGQQDHPEKYYQDFDIFLMTSREDPFPLVCIEVGKMGIPIICFEKATGSSEIILDKGGFVVPYLDCVSMAEKIVLYYQDSELRKQHGDFNRLEFKDFVSDIMAEKIYNCIVNL